MKNVRKVLSFLVISTGISLFAQSNSMIVQVPVIDVEEDYQVVTQRVPVQNCYDVNERVPVNTQNSRNTIGLDTILGGTTGVVIGNQFKKNKDVAKVVGGIGGAIIANNMRKDEVNHYRNVTTQKCDTTYIMEEKTIFKGYKNYFDLNGKKVFKSSSQPLEYINVKVSYSW